MSQVGGDASFVAQIAQTSFDCLKSSRDVPSRTGHSLVLGCLHRYVGGMGSGQHLQTSVSVLHSLAQESSAPTQQVSTISQPLCSGPSIYQAIAHLKGNRIVQISVL